MVTLEDVLEELIQEEIYDEFDRKEKKRLKLARWGFQRWRMFVKKKKRQRGEDVSESFCVRDEPKMAGVVAEAIAQAEGGHPTETTSLLGRLNPFK